jgi:type IV pilus assembly protein PilA
MRARTAAGFSMIEILVALSILGILVALAAPGVYNSLVRDQVVEAASLIDVAKKHVAAVWAAGGTMPANNAEAGLPAPSKMIGNTVTSVSVDNGVITVTMGNKASTVLTGKVLTIRPAVVDDSPVVPVAWVCGNARGPDGMTVRGENRTDVPSYALPVNCR